MTTLGDFSIVISGSQKRQERRSHLALPPPKAARATLSRGRQNNNPGNSPPTRYKVVYIVPHCKETYGPLGIYLDTQKVLALHPS